LRAVSRNGLALEKFSRGFGPEEGSSRPRGVGGSARRPEHVKKRPSSASPTISRERGERGHCPSLPLRRCAGPGRRRRGRGRGPPGVAAPGWAWKVPVRAAFAPAAVSRRTASAAGGASTGPQRRRTLGCSGAMLPTPLRRRAAGRRRPAGPPRPASCGRPTRVCASAARRRALPPRRSTTREEEDEHRGESRTQTGPPPEAGAVTLRPGLRASALADAVRIGDPVVSIRF